MPQTDQLTLGAKQPGTRHRAVITGAASGIGLATMKELQHRGWECLGVDLNGNSEGVVRADVRDQAEIKSVAEESCVTPIDALICAAGIWHSSDDRYATLSESAWRETWEVNVTGAMNTLRFFGPLLRTGSAVVTVASIAALTGMPRMDAYTASKGAIVALTRAWAADLIRRGIRVNCVAPGITETPMTVAKLSPNEEQELPLGRQALPAEIGHVIAELAGRGASYLNGVVIPVDGGLTSAIRTMSLQPRWSV